MGKNLLQGLAAELPFGSCQFQGLRRPLPLHAMVTACGHQRVSPADAYDWHGLRRGNAEFVLIQYTLAGEGALRYEESQHRLRPGQALLLRMPHDHRYYLPPDGTAWQFVYWTLTGREIGRVWSHLLATAGPVLALAPESAAVETLLGLYRGSVAGEELDAFAVSARAYRLAMDLGSAVAGHLAAEVVPEPVRRARHYLREHCTEDVEVADAAAVAALSEAHFSRLFRRHTGMSPRAYLEDARMRRALQLLHDATRSVKEVAHRCGFRDPNYFAKVFRRHTGLSPTDYRRSGMYGP